MESSNNPRPSGQESTYGNSLSIEAGGAVVRAGAPDGASGRRRLTVLRRDTTARDGLRESASCVTTYSDDLIRLILETKGPGYLCDEIQRDQDPSYVEACLYHHLFAYVEPEAFRGKRILDFGCGGGASSCILTRILPETTIVGIDLNEKLLRMAHARQGFYGLENVEFILSPSGDQLPDDLGQFDFVVLSAVFEHLLPVEREKVMPQIWSVLKPGGVFFMDQTPYRYFPLESHTTGLPLLNYLPDGLACNAARRFSKRVQPDATWEVMLRDGIRGGTVPEVLKMLRKAQSDGTPELMQPTRLGCRDRVDLWYSVSGQGRMKAAKTAMKAFFKMVQAVTGTAPVPELALAIRKRSAV